MSTKGSFDKKHEEVVTLLPWYLNQTLSGRDLDEVQKHVADCPTCQREVEELKALQAGVIDFGEDVPAPSSHGIDAVMDRIQAYEAERTTARSNGLWARISRLRSEIQSGWRPPLLAHAAVTLGLLVLVGVLIWRNGQYEARLTREAESTAHYRELANQYKESNERFQTLAAPAGASEKLIRITVRFKETATERQISRLLRSIGGTMASGPSNQGFYTVTVPSPETGREKVAAQAVAHLMADPAVTFAGATP